MRALVAAVAVVTAVGVVGPVALAQEVSAASGDPEVIRVAGLLTAGSPEGDALQAEFDAYAADRKVTIEYEESDWEDLVEMITGPNPPDLVMVPQPGAVQGLADYLVDLGEFREPSKLRRDYGDHLIDLVTVDGRVLGVPTGASLKSLVWYQPAEFAEWGYEVPTTFTELVALSDQMVANGQTPWCAWMFSGPATGWMGTDWVEDLVLGAEGPEVYDQWVAHDVPFTDPRVEQAFDRFQMVMDTPGYVYERNLLLSEHFINNAYPLAAGDCLMHKQGDFFAYALNWEYWDFAVFEFPAVTPAYADAATGAAKYVAAITDSNEVRQLVKFLASPRFGTHAIASSDTRWVLPNTRFDVSLYSHDLTRSYAETVQAALEANQFRFDGSDSMPVSVNWTFWEGVRSLMDGSKTVPQVLADIDASWPT